MYNKQLETLNLYSHFKFFNSLYRVMFQAAQRSGPPFRVYDSPFEGVDEMHFKKLVTKLFQNFINMVEGGKEDNEQGTKKIDNDITTLQKFINTPFYKDFKNSIAEILYIKESKEKEREKFKIRFDRHFIGISQSDKLLKELMEKLNVTEFSMKFYDYLLNTKDLSKFYREDDNNQENAFKLNNDYIKQKVKIRTSYIQSASTETLANEDEHKDFLYFQNFINDIVNDNRPNYSEIFHHGAIKIIIKGNPGVGKTVLAKNIVSYCANSYLNADTDTIPIYLSALKNNSSSYRDRSLNYILKDIIEADEVRSKFLIILDDLDVFDEKKSLEDINKYIDEEYDIKLIVFTRDISDDTKQYYFDLQPWDKKDIEDYLWKNKIVPQLITLVKENFKDFTMPLFYKLFVDLYKTGFLSELNDQDIHEEENLQKTTILMYYYYNIFRGKPINQTKMNEFDMMEFYYEKIIMREICAIMIWFSGNNISKKIIREHLSKNLKKENKYENYIINFFTEDTLNESLLDKILYIYFGTPINQTEIYYDSINVIKYYFIAEYYLYNFLNDLYYRINIGEPQFESLSIINAIVKLLNYKDMTIIDLLFRCFSTFDIKMVDNNNNESNKDSSTDFEKFHLLYIIKYQLIDKASNLIQQKEVFLPIDYLTDNDYLLNIETNNWINPQNNRNNGSLSEFLFLSFSTTHKSISLVILVSLLSFVTFVTEKIDLSFYFTSYLKLLTMHPKNKDPHFRISLSKLFFNKIAIDLEKFYNLNFNFSKFVDNIFKITSIKDCKFLNCNFAETNFLVNELDNNVFAQSFFQRTNFNTCTIIKNDFSDSIFVESQIKGKCEDSIFSNSIFYDCDIDIEILDLKSGNTTTFNKSIFINCKIKKIIPTQRNPNNKRGRFYKCIFHNCVFNDSYDRSKSKIMDKAKIIKNLNSLKTELDIHKINKIDQLLEEINLK